MQKRYAGLCVGFILLIGCTSIDHTDKRHNPRREGPMALYDTMPLCDDPTFQEELWGYLPSGVLRLCLGNRFAFDYAPTTPTHSVEFFTPDHRYFTDIEPGGTVCPENQACTWLRHVYCLASAECMPQVRVRAGIYGAEWFEGPEPAEASGSIIMFDGDTMPVVTDDDVLRTLKSVDNEPCTFYFHVGAERHSLKGAGC